MATTCKEQRIKSRCIIKEKEIGKSGGNGDNCGKKRNTSSGSGDDNTIDEKQLKEFKEIAICMQKCLADGKRGKSKSNDCGGSDGDSCDDSC